MKERVKKDYMLKRFYLRHAVPVMVWLVAVAAVVWLFNERVQRFETVGIARGQVRQIAASSIGRITEIRVQLFSSVKTGQPLVISAPHSAAAVAFTELAARLMGDKILPMTF